MSMKTINLYKYIFKAIQEGKTPTREDVKKDLNYQSCDELDKDLDTLKDFSNVMLKILSPIEEEPKKH